MRWQRTAITEPREGDIMIRKGFLFLPMLIGTEWRWLEIAEWVERYTYREGYLYSASYVWRKVRWK